MQDLAGKKFADTEKPVLHFREERSRRRGLGREIVQHLERRFELSPEAMELLFLDQFARHGLMPLP